MTKTLDRLAEAIANKIADPKILLSVQDACRLLDVRDFLIKRWVNEGLLKPFDSGTPVKRMQFTRAELERFISARP